MYLLVDAGNTRVKWALARGGEVRSHAAATHDNFVAAMTAFLASYGADIEGTVAANVAGTEFQDCFNALLHERSLAEPVWLQSTQELGGIRNAYSVPERLGIDRFVAMLGAKQGRPEPVCVVSVGTAMTVDVVDRSSQHLGGLIVPGPQLMVSSLLSNTSEIAARAANGRRDHSLLAVDTFGAITQGAEQALAALIERVMDTLALQLGEPLTLVLTGGASERIRPHLANPGIFIADLTLRGLAIVAPQVLARPRDI
jgi:type III pantothenate kinase